MEPPKPYTITVDINLMHETTAIPAMDALKRWKGEGKIELVEAEPPRGNPRDPAHGWPGAPKKAPEPGGFRGHKRQRVNKEPAGSPSFRGLAAVIFPHRDYQTLNMSEINVIAHLLKHHSSKNSVFVTHNLKDFIENGKRERLKSTFGIVAMTPDEMVRALSEANGWK